MPATVRLNEIVDALDMQFDEATSFLDRETGKVETVSNDLLRDAEESDEGEDPDLPNWQKEEWEIAKLIVSSERFVALPSKFEVHEWSIMEEFSSSVRSSAVREDLQHAIHGAGAFRHFKHNIRRHGVEQAWFKFRTESLKEIAIAWCKENQIAWE